MRSTRKTLWVRFAVRRMGRTEGPCAAERGYDAAITGYGHRASLPAEDSRVGVSPPTRRLGIFTAAPYERSLRPGRRGVAGRPPVSRSCLLALIVATVLLAGRPAAAAASGGAADAASVATGARAAAADSASSTPHGAGAAGAPVVPIVLGRSVVALNGPWRFHTGDDPRWADPGFDDSAWETVDLTPAPGAHDDDVGLTGYVPGWMARGHADYFGYAWYRLRLSVAAPPGEKLALAGPLYVDSTYQLFLDGRLQGGIGDFSGAQPLVYSRRPLMFLLPPRPASAGGAEISGVVAIRAWMGHGTAGGADAGGVHIAPALGEAEGIAAHNEHQWLEIFYGYVVDVVPALVCLLLVVMAVSLTPIDPDHAAYRWLSLALLLTAALRANQPFYFWTHLETIQVFDLVRNVLLTPLMMASWMMAWRAWFQLRRPAWLPTVVGSLTILYLAAQLFTRAWFSPHLPHPAVAKLALLATCVRWAFVPVLALIAALGIRESQHDRWLALAAILLTAVVVFPPELSVLHVKGIWFPFGVGVSRTEIAVVAVNLPLFILLLRRLHRLARPKAGSP
jgi:hypothetical protein